jgi:hypothetical protein
MIRKIMLAAMAAIVLSAPAWGQIITVTSPAAGVAWCKGSTQTITWTSSGVAGPLSIKLRLADVPDAPPVADISASTDNDGTYSWTIPDSVTAGNYVIRVRTVSESPLVYDDSAAFSIAACSAELPDLELRSIRYTTDRGGQIVAQVFNGGRARFNQDVGFAFALIGVRGGLAPVTRRVDIASHALGNIDLHAFTPESVPLSGMQTRVTLDWQRRIAESNEDNNVQEARLAFLDIRCTAPNGLELSKLYLHGGDDYRVKFHIRVQHNFPRAIRNVRVYWELVRVSSGEVLRGYEQAIASVEPGEAGYTWNVNETYGKIGDDRSRRPRLGNGITYRVNARILDPADAFEDVIPRNDSASFTFSFPD